MRPRTNFSLTQRVVGKRLIGRAALLAILFCAWPLGAQDGAAAYRRNCASCHDAGLERAPSREALGAMAPERVLAAMERGPMISMALRLSAAERRAVAEYVTGKSLGQPLQTVPAGRAMCAERGGALSDRLSKPAWAGWGANSSNSRYQDANTAGIAAADVPRLKLKWAFGFPGDLAENSQPTIYAGRVFVGSQGGLVYSLDASTGCIYWWFDAGRAVRSSIVVSPLKTASGTRYAAFFGDAGATMYALDASTGKVLWKTKVDGQPPAVITGTPALYQGRLYVPVASTEEIAGAQPTYECCRFRGSIAALDAATGESLWKTYTIAQEARPTKKNSAGTQQWGPSGAPIWSSPTVDPKNGALYVTTGDNYSDPPTETSDAFLALDLRSGKILWSRQMTQLDAYNVACRMADKTNCPDSNGPDVDFGAPPILVPLGKGRRALVAGQKSGVVHAVDPDQKGKILWQVRIGHGGSLGGIEWGSAADASNVYVALSDIGRIRLSYSTDTGADPNSGGGMFALRLQDGERAWYTPPPPCGERKRCSPAQSAAVSAIPGIAFSGSMDGHLRAYSSQDGRIVWDFDTVRAYDAVNGVPAQGGSLNGPGPAIAGGMLFVHSGYGVWGGMPGNVLLAFSVDGL